MEVKTVTTLILLILIPADAPVRTLCNAQLTIISIQRLVDVNVELVSAIDLLSLNPSSADVFAMRLIPALHLKNGMLKLVDVHVQTRLPAVEVPTGMNHRAVVNAI